MSINYEILHALEHIRNPILTYFFYFITNIFGGIPSVFVCCIFLHWVYDKEISRRIGINIAISSLIVQILKIIYIVQRPWVYDATLNPIRNTLSAPSGYSFPSAHTQLVTSIFVTLIFIVNDDNVSNKVKEKKRLIQTLSILLILIVAFSRMYFGLHTLLDVSVGLIVALIVALIINIFYKRLFSGYAGLLKLGICVIVLSIFGLIFTYVRYTSGTLEFGNTEDSIKLCSALLGYAPALLFEAKYVKFEEKSSRKNQIIKILIGLILFVGIEKIIKYALAFTIGTDDFAMVISDCVRYIIVLFVIVGIYPLCFKKHFATY